MWSLADVIAAAWLTCCAVAGVAAAGATPLEAQQAAPRIVAGTGPADVPFRTFRVPKPEADRVAGATTERGVRPSPQRVPRATETLLVTGGLGYVQGADWGAELLATGSVGGFDVSYESLVTRGPSVTLFDRGYLSVADADRGWRLEAGDLFSPVRGMSRGARLSWRAAGGREPALAVHGDRRGAEGQGTVVAYRDSVRVGVLEFAGEVGSDAAYQVKSRVTVGPVDVDAAYREATRPVPARDWGGSAGLTLRGGLSLRAGYLATEHGAERAGWRLVSVRVPIGRALDLGLERGYATTGRSADHITAATVNVTAGDLRAFHRQLWGQTAFVDAGPAVAMERRQGQSLAIYRPGAPISVTLQVASEWMSDGRVRHWEELETTVRVGRHATFQAAAAVPGLTDADRLRVRYVQHLPARLSLHLEYGRVSSFQPMAVAGERPRVLATVRKAFGVPTPARGGELRGRVVDHTGRPVVGARVRFGPYAVDTAADGSYLFRHLPADDYELSLDEDYLPADYAWDGRRVRLTLTRLSRREHDLLVAPLNVVHGRVYVDRDGNGRFDEGEGVAGAAVRLGERLTASNADGAYSFYNLEPGRYVVTLAADGVPAGLELAGPGDRAIELTHHGPVTGVDFVVKAKDRPVIWRQVGGGGGRDRDPDR